MYAREDTHYLIYIYHLLRNELLKKAHGDDKLLKAAIERRTDICKTVQFFVFVPTSYLNRHFFSVSSNPF